MGVALCSSCTSKGREMSKHTPGPWSLDIGITGKIEVVATKPMRFNSISAGTPVICDVWRHPEIEDFPGHANARLIAAAPDLLEALKLARSIIGHPDDAHTQMIDAAIAKATGETT